MSRSVDAVCALVFTDPVDRLCVLDITIKNKALHLIRAYMPSDHAGYPDLFWQIELFLMTSHAVVLAGDGNAVLDADIDHHRGKIRY